MTRILAALAHLRPSRALAGGLVAACLSFGFASAPAAAQTGQDPTRKPLVVVELFTSQGCSSCPPADAMMTELATRPGVLPLSLHVDYWDYIGWRDAFAQPQFTMRQKSYAHAIGKRTIYTPQIIVQGSEYLVGAKPMRLADMVLRHMSAPAAPVDLSVARDGDRVSITAVPEGPLPPNMRLQIVRYDPHQRVEIERGENAGRVVDYSNVVTDWRPLTDWDGRAPLALSTDAVGEDHIAVILQAATPGGPGPILAAARVE